MSTDSPRHEQPNRCTRCHRALRVSTGMGPTCARRERAEQAFKPEQVEKAIEVIELRAISRVGRTSGGRALFRVVASKGLTTYLTSRIACTCPAGVRGVRCYHRLSAVYAA